MFRNKSFLLVRFLCCFGLSACITAQTAETFPKIEGESLAGKKVVFPDAARGKVLVLVFGFTKASKGPTSAWVKRLTTDLGSQSEFVVYQLPVLEAVPRFIRGMVISSMRKDQPAETREHFVPILKGEEELKKLVGYTAPDDAYLVLLDRDGKILKQRHGVVSDPSYAAFRADIMSALHAPHD